MHAPRHTERPRRGRVARLTRRGRQPGAGDRRPSAHLVLLAALAALLACRRSSPPQSRSPVEPRRVVALAPNLTEIVFLLGAGGSLVGVSDYSDFPAAARSIPRVGGLEVSAERVASLTPDLVLATVEGNARGPVSALMAAGLRVLVLPTGSLDAVLQTIRRTGEALGRSARAEQLVSEFARRRAAVRARMAGRTRRRAILLVWPDPPQAAGGGTFLDDVLSEAGAENLVGNRPGWPILSAEFLSTAPIDALVFPTSPANLPAFERALSSGALSRGAVRRARVIQLDESALTRPGPRVFDVLEELAGQLHPGAGIGNREPGAGK